VFLNRGYRRLRPASFPNDPHIRLLPQQAQDLAPGASSSTISTCSVLKETTG
jgi:hypothetical protein